MTITIRRATDADLNVVVEFNRLLARETEAKSLDLPTLTAGVAAILGDPARGWYELAVDADTGAVLGQASVTTEWSDWRDGWFWWLQSVYVRPEWRGRGVLRTLFDHLRCRAEAAGDVVGFRLYVESENQAARRAYAGLGMHRSSYQFFEMLTPGRSGG